MKIKIGNKYITEFNDIVPRHEWHFQPNNKCCDICELWYMGYRVHIGRFFGIKYLVWEEDQPSEEK